LKVDSDAIQTWMLPLNYRQWTSKLERYPNDHDREKEAGINAKKEQLHFEEEIQKIKLQLKADNPSRMKSQTEETGQALSSCGVQAKLSKLVITKFDASQMDWQRFWGQFLENIGKTRGTPITKFT